MARKASFDDLVKAIQQAFIEVNAMSESQHLQMLKTYFEEDGTPKVLQMQYPYFDENGIPAYRHVSIPQICLVPISSLKMDSITVDFRVKLYGDVDLNTEETNTVLGYVPHGGFGKKDDGYANIKLKFSSQEPPEGLMRIRDQFIKVTI